MAIIKAVNSRASIGHVVNYITREAKTDTRLIGGYNCNPQTALDEMQDTKRAWGKTDGRQYKHFLQSFPAGEDISLDEAFEIAGKWVERCPLFQAYEVCYATHKDRSHVHTHVVVNSVSFENGLKFNQSRQDLQRMKDLSDVIMVEHGKCICEKNKEITSFRMGAYRSIEKAVKGEYKSWMYDTMLAVDKAMKTAASRAEFIQAMGAMGYTVDWRENHKYIVFINAGGKKVRDKTLPKTFKVNISKEGILYEISKHTNQPGRTAVNHRGIESGDTRRRQPETAHSGKRAAQRSVGELQERFRRVSGIDGGNTGEARVDDTIGIKGSERQQQPAGFQY